MIPMIKKKALVIGSTEFIVEVRDILERLSIGVEIATAAQEVKERLTNNNICIIIFDDDSFALQDTVMRLKLIEVVQGSGVDFVIVSSDKKPQSIIEAKNLGAADYILKPLNIRELTLHLSAVINKKTRISCIGGGTGLFNLLSSLKMLPNCLLTSIVNMSDSGGSSGALRVSFGVLPPGDVRRSLVALSNAPEIMNRLMHHRFKDGDSLSGHSFGNLFLVALNEIEGSMLEAVRRLGDILHIEGIVIPVADTQTTLCARLEDGAIIKGEDKIDLPEGKNANLRIKEVWHEPPVQCNSAAYASIINSDFVIIGPGDLYTSIITNLLVKSLSSAILLSKAKKIYICNLMTKAGETANYNAFDHTSEVIKYLGEDCLDYVIISNTRLSDKAIYEYSKMNQSPVKIGDAGVFGKITRAKIILADVSHETELVRHDHIKFKNEIKKIIDEKDIDKVRG